MGNLLGSPVVDKETHVGSTEEFEFGLSSMQGWRVHMEDAHIAEANLYAVVQDEAMLQKLSSNQTTGPGGAPTTAVVVTTSEANSSNNNNNITTIPLPGHSFFGVFDGHGGTFAAQYTGDNLTRILSKQPLFAEYALFYHESLTKTFANEAERVQFLRSGVDYLEGALKQAFVETDWEIALAIRGTPHPDANTPYQLPGTINSVSAEHAAAATAAVSHDQEHRTDNDDAGNHPDDEQASNSNNGNGGDTVMEVARQAAANQARALDDDGDSGTTACCVLITPDWLVCANAGDSRAVFSRKMSQGGAPVVPLSYDHKPDDEAEERRVRTAGGYVAGGRVEGDLAVSRGLGDFRFKSMPTVLSNFCLTTGIPRNPLEQFQGQDLLLPGDQKVSPIPDIILQTRNREQDEFVIVACDGIWDVRSNEECVAEVATIFQEGEADIGLVCEEVRKGTQKKDFYTAFLSVSHALLLLFLLSPYHFS